jgi:hypothetical protein
MGAMTRTIAMTAIANAAIEEYLRIYPCAARDDAYVVGHFSRTIAESVRAAAQTKRQKRRARGRNR